MAKQSYSFPHFETIMEKFVSSLSNSKVLNRKIIESLESLRKYCESENFKGYDPYDGLNSRFFKAISLLPKSRIARLAWIQFFKRSPLNLRPLVGIKKDYNPKAMGLFLSSYCHLYKAEPKQEYLDRMNF